MLGFLKNSDGTFSKTKTGALLVGVSALLATIAGVVTGSVTTMAALEQVIAEVGAVCAAFGIRDIPFLNASA